MSEKKPSAPILNALNAIHGSPMTIKEILAAHFQTAIMQKGNPKALADELLTALDLFGWKIVRK